MAGITDLEENIARLERATEAARAATSEAHAAVKDMNRVRKEVETLLTTGALTLVDDAVRPVVEKGLAGLSEQFEKSSRATYDRVLAQTDILLNIAMGRPGKHNDLRPMIAAKLREWLDEQMRALDA